MIFQLSFLQYFLLFREVWLRILSISNLQDFSVGIKYPFFKNHFFCYGYKVKDLF